MRVFALALCVLLSISVSVLGQAPNLERMDIVLKSVPDGPVARVRGVNIPPQVFVKFYLAETARLASLGEAPLTMEARADLGRTCLRVLVQQELLFQEAQAKKLKVGEEEISEAWEVEREKLHARAARAKGSKVSDAELLAAAGYNSEEQILKEVRRSLLIEKMARRIVKKSIGTVDKSDVKKFYEARKEQFTRPDTLHLQQIFVKAPMGKSPREKKAREDARMKVDDALERVLAGQSFDGLVRQISDGKNAEAGGHAGPMPMKEFPSFMVKAALQQQPGEVSEVLESAFGFHIIRLVEFSHGRQAKIEEADPFIRNILEDQQGRQVIARYCEKLVSAPGELLVFLELDKNLAYLTH